MTQVCSPYFKMPSTGCFILSVSLAALGFVYLMQYGFDLQPCVLCLWQRLPFALAALTALMALVWKPYGKPTIVLLALCAVIFLSGTGLAIFHSGVERHWWAGTSGCASHPLSGNSAEDLRNQLLQTPVTRCDHISWTLLRLSMANWNIVLSFGLSLFSAFAALQHSRSLKARS